ncbi:hypothetical protein C8P68_10487 [Mucilaginibacter yixingensis]|uniref:GDSL-like lipase/acylhydrolase family protein n=1 Tax=Mucilaginibacter yixingensis TaxID=1295612 RepID=A0A2T5J948_9SPHI|nr:hypothetical protein [Mucilaginibacter yixingensis]PTQ96602.1 hypothetical protein C8P68_10487 [Mucilaginibacter yixingensis]
MKTFLIKVLTILLIILAADRAFSLVVKALFKTTTTTDEYKLNAVTYQMNAPVIFMGSSRCHHHYVPSIIQDTLKTPVYNAGLWGLRNIYFQYGLLCNILERYTPKTICLEVHPIDYLATPFSQTAITGSLTPYINISPGCDEVLKVAGLYYKSEIFELYRYNSQFANIVAGNLSTRTLASDKGFKPLYGKLDTTFKITPERFPFAADSAKIHYLQAFIDKCKEKHIQLIFLFSPFYAVEKNHIVDIPDSIARKNHIPFINHYNLAGFTGHPEVYYDFGHLNETGAKKYSAVIASELKRYIKNQ